MKYLIKESIKYFKYVLLCVMFIVNGCMVSGIMYKTQYFPLSQKGWLYGRGQDVDFKTKKGHRRCRVNWEEITIIGLKSSFDVILYVKSSPEKVVKVIIRWKDTIAEVNPSCVFTELEEKKEVYFPAHKCLGEMVIVSIDSSYYKIQWDSTSHRVLGSRTWFPHEILSRRELNEITFSSDIIDEKKRECAAIIAREKEREKERQEWERERRKEELTRPLRKMISDIKKEYSQYKGTYIARNFSQISFQDLITEGKQFVDSVKAKGLDTLFTEEIKFVEDSIFSASLEKQMLWTAKWYYKTSSWEEEKRVVSFSFHDGVLYASREDTTKSIAHLLSSTSLGDALIKYMAAVSLGIIAPSASHKELCETAFLSPLFNHWIHPGIKEFLQQFPQIKMIVEKSYAYSVTIDKYGYEHKKKKFLAKIKLPRSVIMKMNLEYDWGTDELKKLFGAENYWYYTGKK